MSQRVQGRKWKCKYWCFLPPASNWPALETVCLMDGLQKFSSDCKTNQNMDWEITLGVSSQVRRWMMQESRVAVEQEGFKPYIKRKLELNVLDSCFLWGSPREGTGDWGAIWCPPWGIPDDKPGHVCLGKKKHIHNVKENKRCQHHHASIHGCGPVVYGPGSIWILLIYSILGSDDTHSMWLKVHIIHHCHRFFRDTQRHICHTWTATQKSDWQWAHFHQWSFQWVYGEKWICCICTTPNMLFPMWDTNISHFLLHYNFTPHANTERPPRRDVTGKEAKIFSTQMSEQGLSGHRRSKKLDAITC